MGRDPRLVEVGNRIKNERLRLGMDQKDLAELVHVNEKSVSNWEIGKHSPVDKLPDIATALGVSEIWLWKGERERPDTDNIVKVLEEQVRIQRSLLDELRLIRYEQITRKDGATLE